ncbi:MAG TPA: LamG-like jellyroll fold domain-containing protein [Pantanalinema sp.]
MRPFRLILTSLLAALVVLGCRPAPLVGPSFVATIPATPLLAGRVILPEGYETQAGAGSIRANATVTLLDPSTLEARATGITAPDGTFTVQAPGSFTPVLDAPYLLESTKTLGGTGSAAFRLRTLVSLTAAGWTSISGSKVQLSSATTAAAILWDHLGLAASDVMGAVTWDAVTGTHRFATGLPNLSEAKAREVEGLVTEALRLNLDPIQLVRPGPGGAFRLGLSGQGSNMLINPGFEQASPSDYQRWSWQLWTPGGNATDSVVVGGAQQGARFARITTNSAGDVWLGQGHAGTPPRGANPFSLVAGRPYTFSVHARGAVGGEKIQLTCATDRLVPGPSFNGPSVALTTAWKRYSLTFTPTVSSPHNIVFVRVGSVAGQAVFPATVDVDAAQLEEGAAATGFEAGGSLIVDGFGSAVENVGTTDDEGRVGRGVVVDSGVNMIANSSVELDSDGNGVPDGMMVTSVTPDATFSLDATVPRFGQRSLKIVRTGAADNTLGYFDSGTYHLKAGKSYTFSLWVRGQNVSAGGSATDLGLRVNTFRNGGVVVSTFAAACPIGTFDWTRLSVSFSVSEDCRTVFYPLFRNKTGTAWFDGFQIEEGDVATPYAGDSVAPDRLSFDARAFNMEQGAIAFWIRPAYSWEEAGGVSLFKLNNPSFNTFVSITKRRRTDGRYEIYFSSYDPGGSHLATWVPTSAPWQRGEWHHVAATWGSRGLELYWDGELRATDPYAGRLGVTELPALLSFSSPLLIPGANGAVLQNATLDGLQVWDVQKAAEWVRRAHMGVVQ